MTPAIVPELAHVNMYALGAPEIFTLFFIMLGPIKVIGPFFAATQGMERAALRRLAVRVTAISAISVVLGGWIGALLMVKWRISVPVMQIAAGVVFLLAALAALFGQYRAPAPAGTVPAQDGAMHLAFPVTVTPYGIAAVILLCASSHDATRMWLVMGLALGVIVLDLLAMLAAAWFMRHVGVVPLQILGAVLGVLQVALALTILVNGIQKIQPPPVPATQTIAPSNPTR
ncbi:MarC family protein [Lysobacter arvi]|uniref:UPF0056 membrane protein n=1 Tax=Lysobacter arvi TaxID=3038776 RepID=A0ABU1CGZ7_9GAMM|nr:MarC family protein [Lysobacter arvi]MDR0184233.1 MarC family protein [Lysobacter arvi]